MAIANKIRREVEVRVKTYEVRYFDNKTGEKIVDPEWKLISDEANFEGLGIIKAIKWLMNYLPEELKD